MKVLIIGASSKTSVGYYIGEYLRETFRCEVIYVSRSGGLGVNCDLNEYHQVNKLFDRCHLSEDDVVINTAGVFTCPQLMGDFENLTGVKDHLLVKSYGAWLLGEVCVKRSVGKLIMLGGRESVSGNGAFSVYDTANGSLWAVVKTISEHHLTPKVYYLDIPAIRNSTMLNNIGQVDEGYQATIGSFKVNQAVESIINGLYPSGTRIVVE